MALLTLADSELRGYGTDGTNTLSEPQITLVLRALQAVCSRLDFNLEVPFRNFSGFRSYWMRKGASGHEGWQARRDLVDELFGEAFGKLEILERQPRGPRLDESVLAGLTDPAAIQDHLNRLQRAVNDDLALAIGSAKELIESTAKTVLIERGMEMDERTDLPVLVKEAQQALGLHPSSATLGPDGTEAVRKILGGVLSIAIGVAELRNRGYGTGHGGAGARAGLSKRHAHLAVNAAITWCQLMLDTLIDPTVPWRSS
ncbi:abortive infection family protein [Arthrobacter sp. H20]|uniref:abortive infection family protein n=1 Tax=Arthrobacter sp. H20 TaxID=1267981 RepID=UPI0009DF9402|nr:abortive infection family protein [Arthrobacter sp. H20]